MWTSQKVFRRIWRINAVLILVAAGAIALAVGSFVLDEFNRRIVQRRETPSGVTVEEPLAGKDSSTPLILGRATAVKGTNILSADLLASRATGKRFGSDGDSTNVRNVLFIEPGEKSGRWLLPDNSHVISDSNEITDGTGSATERALATVALVKAANDADDVPGKLVLYGPSGKNVVEVAKNVARVHLASFSGGELTILYERNRRFVLAEFNPNSLAKLKEQEIDVPVLK